MALLLERDAIRTAVSEIDFRTQAFIGGTFVDASDERTFPTENPATGELLANVAECGPGDVDRAVQAARTAFDEGPWPRMAPAERKRILLEFADRIDRASADLAITDSLEAGKPIAECVNTDVPETVDCIRWHAEAADKLYDQVAPTGPDNVALVVREPVGVVGAIVPWNFPVLMAAWKIGPALATGNTVVLKPARLTSLSALHLAELAAEAGLPDGVLNVVPGAGGVAGQAIGRHLAVDAITFTGSTEVGRLLLKYSAESNLKRVTLECGGKSPQLVMADAPDLERVADHVVDAAFWNMGENCSCGSRLIVHASLHDRLLELVTDHLGRWVPGDPLDPSTLMGPMIERSHLEKVLNYIESGKREGARTVIGGNRALQESGGYFVEPTVFDRVRGDMTIAREEIFGPVLSTMSFDTEEEGVAFANDTNYGLAASLHTSDLATAHRVSRALKAGTVSVNCFSEGDITTPFGGYRESGFGGRDNGVHAHDQYTELKTIWMDLSS
jgi:gamma-glutamyl-gamma-aminobutyraldehyde dehydrogenase